MGLGVGFGSKGQLTIAWEGGQNNAGSEGASRVETAASEVDSGEFSDEE